MVPDKDGITECSRRVIAFADAANPNTNIRVTILDESKGRINFQVKLEQLDVSYNTTNDLTKQERARKMFKTEVNVTYDRDTIVVVTLKIAKEND